MTRAELEKRLHWIADLAGTDLEPYGKWLVDDLRVQLRHLRVRYVAELRAHVYLHTHQELSNIDFPDGQKILADRMNRSKNCQYHY